MNTPVATPLKKIIFISLTIIFGLLLIPIIFYAIHFHDTAISSDPGNWGVFGDFFGGILNPIIALLNLFALGYLTYLVSRQGNEENRKLFILEKRMNAYEELTRDFKEIESFMDRASRASLLLTFVEKVTPDKKLDYATEVAKEVIDASRTYRRLYHTLKTFNLRYGHLFNYNFQGDQFKKFIEAVDKGAKIYETSVDRFVEGKANDKTLTESEMPAINSLALEVISSIRKEVYYEG